jgi:N-acetylglucosaminyl-diphospho-decaprenol L-rhamnosyltransferase
MTAAKRRYMPKAKQNLSLSIVLVTYNSEDVLPGLLDSLSAGLEGIDRYEVFVVDNESKDSSVSIALSHPIGTTVISMGRNAGYAAGINAAVARFKLDSHVLILNPDARLLRGAARALVDRLADPAVGVAVPLVMNDDGTPDASLRREPSLLTAWSDGAFGSKIAARLGLGEILLDTKTYELGGAVDWATGAVLAVSAETKCELGDWDETFFLYSEEVDYMRRVRDSGRQVVLVPQAKATHIGGAYHANPRLSALMTANRIRYYRRHHGAVATFFFRLGIILASAARFVLGPGHRAALVAALKPWTPPPETLPQPGVQPVVVGRKLN